MINPETKFENFCARRNWKFYKIPQLTNIKTPDFFVDTGKNVFIVEIKNLSESGLEREDIEVIEGEIPGISYDYWKEVDSIVYKIDEANEKFKNFKSLRVPQIIIIYSERKFVSLNKEILFYAVYGKIFQQLAIRQMKNDFKNDIVNLPPIIVDRTLRYNKNNLISAVGIPNSDNEEGMFILHNLWTDVNLSFSVFNDERDVNHIPKEIKFEEVKSHLIK